jgi:xanthine dehydrogenase iron-sulfur cluster and FAD-binding subunit A
MSNIETKDPDAEDSNFGGIVTAVGFEECVELLARVLPESQQIDSDLAGEMIAAALSLGGYIGAELAMGDVTPPDAERAELRAKVRASSAAIDRIVAHVRENARHVIATEIPS